MISDCLEQCQYENKNVSAFLECSLFLLRERMASEEGFPMYLKIKCPSGRVRGGGGRLLRGGGAC